MECGKKLTLQNHIIFLLKNLTQKKKKILCRALGMIWIIAGHLFFYGPASVENLQMVLTYAEEWYLQPLFSVAIAVDTYFVIR